MPKFTPTELFSTLTPDKQNALRMSYRRPRDLIEKLDNLKLT